MIFVHLATLKSAAILFYIYQWLVDKKVQKTSLFNLVFTNYPLRTMTFGHLFHRYLGAQKNLAFARFVLAPTIWFEQMTDRLTADCSTAELSRNKLGGRYRNWTDIKGFAVLCMSHSANRPPVPNSLVISIYTNIFARVNSFFTKSAFFLHMCKKSLFLNAIL